MYNERKRKIIENVIVGVIVLGIVVGAFVLYESGPEPFTIKPAPTAENGVYDFDDFLYWLDNDVYPSGYSQSAVARVHKFPVDGKEREYCEVYTDGVLTNYKGTLVAKDIVWCVLEDGNTIYCDLYYPVGEDDGKYLIAELNTGVCVLFSKWGR